MHVALVPQGQTPNTAQAISGFAPRLWTWHNTNLNGERLHFEIDSPGPYTLYIWPQEDGVYLDQITLSNNPLYYPGNFMPQ